MHKFYTLCGTVLLHVSEAKYHGVTLSNDSGPSIFQICLLRPVLPPAYSIGIFPSVIRPLGIEQAYISLIRSRLEFCSAIWDPHLVKDIDMLENIQRRAARFTVQDYSRYTSVSALLKGLDWSPLKDHRRDICLTFLFEIIKGKLAMQAGGSLVAADSSTRKRHDHKYRHLRVCTEQFRNSFFPQTIPEWNSLPGSCVKMDTVAAFKEQLRRTP